MTIPMDPTSPPAAALPGAHRCSAARGTGHRPALRWCAPLRLVARAVRAVISFLFVLAATATVALAFAAYLAATGRVTCCCCAARSPSSAARCCRRPAHRLPRWRPARPAPCSAGTLGGEATVTVRRCRRGRSLFFLLLNDGLRLRGAWQVGDAGDARAAGDPAPAGLLVIVQLPSPLAASTRSPSPTTGPRAPAA
ncbi:MAG: hypothetical protein U0802_08365 [Candidatus Binatia bacterium]